MTKSCAAVPSQYMQHPSHPPWPLAKIPWYSERADFYAFAVLLGLALTVYWPIFEIRSLGDDNLYVLAWADQASLSSLASVDPAIYPEWRPLAYFTIWLEHLVVPLRATWIHHAINLILWVTCSWLVYRIVREVVASRLAGLVAATLVLSDRRAISAMTWVVERQSPLACAFGFGAVLLVVRLRRSVPTARACLAVGGLLLASALSKEYGLAFAAALVFYGWREGQRRLLCVGLASGFIYILLRAALANGAINLYCEDMGYGLVSGPRCVDPVSGTGISQMAYNAIATTVGIPLPGLFDDLGMVDVRVRLLGASAFLLLIAAFGVLSHPAVRLMVMIAIANGVLSFMIYRGRNQLIGVCAMGIAIGVGLALLKAAMANWKVAQLFCVSTVIVVAVLGRNPRATAIEVGRVIKTLQSEKPCESDLRMRAFADRLRPIVNPTHGLEDPTCLNSTRDTLTAEP